MEFLKEILAGTKKYFLLDEVAKINVPFAPWANSRADSKASQGY